MNNEVPPEWMPPNVDPERRRWDRRRLFQQTTLLYTARSMADPSRLAVNGSVILQDVLPNGETRPTPVLTRRLSSVKRFSDSTNQLISEHIVHYLPDHKSGEPCYALEERTMEDGNPKTNVSIGTDEWLVLHHNDAAFATYQGLKEMHIGEEMLQGLGLNVDGTEFCASKILSNETFKPIPPLLDE